MNNDQKASQDIASKFLDAQMALELSQARPLAHDDFVAVSPGGRETGLDALFDRLKTGYRALEKIPDARDTAFQNGAWIIYTSGVMRGVRADGKAFENVRFIDRITVRDGLVERQDIWNDFGHLTKG